MASPCSDERLWSTLRGRVDAILADSQAREAQTCRPSSSSSSFSQRAPEMESASLFTEDSLLLSKGFESASSSLAQLTGILNVATQEARKLGKAYTSDSEAQGGEFDKPKTKKRSRPSLSPTNGEEKKPGADFGNGQKQGKADRNLGNVKKMAIAMATKAAALARELKKVKAELEFVLERSNQLQEENRRLREGLREEEDDLVRLQLETLLSEKARLANENAILTRENQCLHQMVEYHQLTSEELLESYEEVIQGTRLDFSPLVDGFADVTTTAESKI